MEELKKLLRTNEPIIEKCKRIKEIQIFESEEISPREFLLPWQR